jgi:hypothetical protein
MLNNQTDIKMEEFRKYYILTFKYGTSIKVYSNGRTKEQVKASQPAASRISEEIIEDAEQLEQERLQREVERSSTVFRSF